MQHEIIMPALGMSQDTGTLVAWHKSEGEAVVSGDIIFEVETDKTTMEVEAPADGFIVGICAEAGAEVPVGKVIAFIADSADASVPNTKVNARSDASDTVNSELPDGQQIIMPTLGMAQDSGLLVAWSKTPGEKVDADDVLFEVETDKSIAEVTAGHSGYLVARLAAAGEDIPTGATIAIISDEPVAEPIDRGYQANTVPIESTESPDQAEAKPSTSIVSNPTEPSLTFAPAGARVLATPKLKRLAMLEGLDLQRLVDAGIPQPYHCSDLQQLRDLNEAAAKRTTGNAVEAKLEVSGSVKAEGFDLFLNWLKANTNITDEAQVLASLVGASATSSKAVGVASLGDTFVYRTHQQISATAVCDEAEEIHLRDLRNTFIDGAEVSCGSVPEITLLRRDDQLKIQLCAPQGTMEPAEALNLINNFAARLADPMRQLL